MKTVLNDLYDYGLKIYQQEQCFKFSLDSLLLAEFVKVKNDKQQILDLCSGNAAIPLVLSTKYSNQIYGMELQKEIHQMAIDSVKFNNKERQIKIINANVLNALQYFNNESIDIITCNPPYFKYNKDSLTNENEIKAIARHEIKITLENLIEQVSKILKNKGEFYLVHRTERLEEIISVLNDNNFAVKVLQFVYTKNEYSELVLIKAVKNGRISLKVNPPLYTNNLKTFKNIF